MPETTIQRNALARVQQAVQEGKIPVAKDLRLVEEMTTMEAFETLDKVDTLKQQRSHQATSQENTAPLPRTVKPLTSSLQSTTGGPSPSDAGPSGVTPERKKPITGREKDYYNFFDKRFGPLIVLILYFTLADLDKAVFYAPTPEECHEVAPHLARIGPRVEDMLHLPKWAHDAVIMSDDTFVVGMVLVGYLDRIGILEKIMPWVQSWASKGREMRERTQFKAGTGPVQPGADGRYNPPPGGQVTGSREPNPAINPADQYHVPLEHLGVYGIGEQDRAEP